MSQNGQNGTNGAITHFGFDTGMQSIPAYVPGSSLATGGGGSELEEWVRMACMSGAIDAIMISRLQHGAGNAPVNRIPCGPLDPDKLAAQIQRVCENNARGFGRQASYEIEACVHDASTMSGFRTVASHIITAGSSDGRSRGEVEPPNEAGFTSQVMRHKEADQTTQHKMMLAVWDRLMADNHGLREENAFLKGSFMQVMEKLKEYTILSADEQGRLKRAEIRGEVEKHAIAEITKMIPVGLQLLATKFAAQESVVFQRLKAFAEGITEEQYAQIGMILKPEQSIQLMEMLGKQDVANQIRAAIAPVVVPAAAAPEPAEEKK